MPVLAQDNMFYELKFDCPALGGSWRSICYHDITSIIKEGCSDNNSTTKHTENDRENDKGNGTHIHQ